MMVVKGYPQVGWEWKGGIGQSQCTDWLVWAKYSHQLLAPTHQQVPHISPETRLFVKAFYYSYFTNNYMNIVFLKKKIITCTLEQCVKM